MSPKLLQGGLCLSLCLSAPLVLAATATKTYQVDDLKMVVSNSDHCEATYSALQEATKDSVTLHFTKIGSSSFSAKDEAGQLTNHHYAILKQHVTQNKIDRVGMGSFDVNHQKINYVIEIAADLKKKDFNYSYPIIFSSDDTHCYFTALIKPDEKTVEKFKSNIQNKKVTDGSDLTR